MKPPHAIGSVSSSSGHATAYRRRSLLRVRRHGASKPQGSSERMLPWQVIMDQFNIRLSFPHLDYIALSVGLYRGNMRAGIDNFHDAETV